jgi:hypothetical protein
MTQVQKLVDNIDKLSTTIRLRFDRLMIITSQAIAIRAELEPIYREIDEIRGFLKAMGLSDSDIHGMCNKLLKA